MTTASTSIKPVEQSGDYTLTSKYRRRWWTLAVLSLSLVIPIPTIAENWPSWRGPNGNGISDEASPPEGIRCCRPDLSCIVGNARGAEDLGKDHRQLS